MTKKSRDQMVHRAIGTQNRKLSTHPDEITLRDEILELKREVMVLKKTNEQYIVKLRKYEDEAKRKDKYLEQLMDPRKNSDITKVLSTKGAAILMNLKDQNNTLIQMITNKDLHIRRLLAEIKMSKLYASTKKNESYRAEISRLKNLLLKSQEILKENLDYQEQSRSICISGNSFLEFSSSSDQSSPRDLDELRLTILNLESHIQQSNDILAKKNEEISLLRDEVNFLKKFSTHKLFKNKTFNCVSAQPKAFEFSTTFTSDQPDAFATTKILSQDIIDLFHKNTSQEYKKLLNPEQDDSEKWISTINTIPKYNFQPYVTDEITELIETNQESTKVNKRCSESSEPSLQTEKSVFYHLAAEEIKREEKILPNLKKTVSAKEKWKKALNKYRKLKKFNSTLFSDCVQLEVYNKNINKKAEFLLEEKEFQTTVQLIQNCQILEKDNYTNAENQLENSNSPDLFIKEKNEKILSTSESSSNDDNVFETCQSYLKESTVSELEGNETEDTVLTEKTPTVNKLSNPQSPSDHQKELVITSNIHISNEMESESSEPFREIFFKSFDSSFDSEYDYSVKEVQQVQVEVQINSVSSESDNDQAGNNTSETNHFYDYDKENNGNHAPELEFDDDDDDVIIREK